MRISSRSHTVDLQLEPQHKGGAFKIASLTRWNVVLSSRELIDEYRQAADDTFSLDEVANEVC